MSYIHSINDSKSQLKFLKVQHGLRATVTGAPIVSPCPLGDPGFCPVLWDVPPKNQLYYSVPSPQTTPEGLQQGIWTLRGKPKWENEERYPHIFRPEVSFFLLWESVLTPSGWYPWYPRTYSRIVQIHSPHLALHHLPPVGMGAVGLDCWGNLNLDWDMERHRHAWKFCTVDGTVKWCNCCGKQYGDYSKS